MKIIRNTLDINELMGTLKLESDYYIVTIYYVGNYAEDVKEKLDPGYLSASIKMKTNMPEIDVDFREKELYMNFGKFAYCRADEVDEFFIKVNIAKEEMKALKQILEEHFFSFY